MSLIRKLQSQKSGQKNDFVFMSIIKNIWWFFLNPFTIIIWKRYTGRCDYVTCWLIHEQHWEQKLVSINIKNKKIILRISNCKFIVKWTINWQFINLCYKCFSSQCMTIKCIKKKKRKEEEAFFCQNITISTVSQSAIDREVQTSPLNLKTLHLYLSIST